MVVNGALEIIRVACLKRWSESLSLRRDLIEVEQELVVSNDVMEICALLAVDHLHKPLHVQGSAAM